MSTQGTFALEEAQVARRFRRSALGKYAAIAALSFRQRLAERGALIARAGFMVVILLIFSRVWEAALELQGEGWRPARTTDTLWYLLATEWVTLSQPAIYNDIKVDVESGDVAYKLGRPISYIGSRLAEAFGDMVLRWLVLGISGVAVVYGITGAWPSAGAEALAFLPLGAIASVLLMLGVAGVGLTSFWLEDCVPVYWVFQKLLFLFGGLMLPLSIYPEWLRQVAERSPFAAMLYGPASLMFEVSAEHVLQVLSALLMWCLVFSLVVFAMEYRGRRALQINGG